MAISSPLLETSINGAKGVLINVTGSMDIGLEEVETAANLVQEAAHPDANIIFGAAFDESLEDEIRVTVIATGFDQAPNSVPTAPSAAGGASRSPGSVPGCWAASWRGAVGRLLLLPNRRSPRSVTTTGIFWSVFSARNANL